MDAQYRLGCGFLKRNFKPGYGARLLDLNGQRVRVPNTSKAFQYLIKAADQGHPGAQCELGNLYSAEHEEDPILDANQQPVQCPDAQKAMHYYNLAAEKGSAEALYILGTKAEEETSTPDHLQKAFEFYLSAAEKNHAGALYCLGKIYENYRGILIGNNHQPIETPDMQKAIESYENAAKKGHSEAQQVLDRLTSESVNSQDATQQPEVEVADHESEAALIIKVGEPKPKTEEKDKWESYNLTQNVLAEQGAALSTLRAALRIVNAKIEQVEAGLTWEKNARQESAVGLSNEIQWLNALSQMEVKQKILAMEAEGEKIRAEVQELRKTLEEQRLSSNFIELRNKRLESHNQFLEECLAAKEQAALSENSEVVPGTPSPKKQLAGVYSVWNRNEILAQETPSPDRTYSAHMNPLAKKRKLSFA
jgi:TPR repeat protein